MTTRSPLPPSPFATAADNFAAALPQRVEASDEDLVKIKIPGKRYDDITLCVLRMYEKADARVMPLPVFDVAVTLGYAPIPYRAAGQRLYEACLKTSMDAFTIQAHRTENPMIFFNDRCSPTRINFSIMHEIAHIMLGHQEQSALAEIEANYFAGVALCPVDLLAHHNVTTVSDVMRTFNVSEEFAQNRLRTLRNRRNVSLSDAAVRFRQEVVSRFTLQDPRQLSLFQDGVFAIGG